MLGKSWPPCGWNWTKHEKPWMRCKPRVLLRLFQRNRRNAGRVSDGDRTHGHWSHNPALYQLSYAHQIKLITYPTSQLWLFSAVVKFVVTRKLSYQSLAV